VTVVLVGIRLCVSGGVIGSVKRDYGLLSGDKLR
jgi:hypothetical protein